MSATISEQLADFVLDLKFDQLPGDTVGMVKLCFLDWLGSAVAGGPSKPTQAMLAVARDLGGNQEATLVPNGKKTSAFLAALVNGGSSHVVEMDDVHKESILHPAAAVIPAALAMAEREGASGEELLAAIVAGYEVAIRAGEAMGPSHYRFWHTTATCGTFGAAAAAGKLLGLDKAQMVAAFGSAGTQAAGLWPFLAEGAMSKQLHPAKAAADGLLSALLAQQGFTGATRIFEDEAGFCRAMAQEPDLTRFTDGLGKPPYRIMDTCFKAYAACYHIHSAIDATLQICREQKLAGNSVQSVTVRLYQVAVNLLGKVQLANPYVAKFHVPFCLATAMQYGSVGLEAFTEERLASNILQDLMAKISLAHEPDLDKDHPAKFPAIVEIVTKAGDKHAARVDYPKGDSKNPMTTEELTAKFQQLAAQWPDGQRKRLVEQSLALEHVENMAALFDDEA
jgi:2-methylcitrate dehydratase PrpD